jgi:hypothetical protein
MYELDDGHMLWYLVVVFLCFLLFLCFVFLFFFLNIAQR